MLEGNNWQGFVDIANNLLSAGAPLHCLGVQVRSGPMGSSGMVELWLHNCSASLPAHTPAGRPGACTPQAHLTAGGAQREAIYRRLDEMGATGLPLYITEFSLSSRHVGVTVSAGLRLAEIV